MTDAEWIRGQQVAALKTAVMRLTGDDLARASEVLAQAHESIILDAVRL